MLTAVHDRDMLDVDLETAAYRRSLRKPHLFNSKDVEVELDGLPYLIVIKSIAVQ